ncbi:precorrin-3B synthase [Methylobacterium sp. J-026]|uniref:precorrin-3B synthase n=1 Tax=Methylobacterium sp. J-026 TaxID=2836624 RepID=UPI001FBB15FA|nr:precorrin-3B synthase [Methylobacterium sp. J-026]MCJ2133959.1 precorrin-3B synthase [Methylobacterium sp. J-026]
MSARPHRRALPEAAARRGWCPSLARPMPTGDGLLARVHPPLGVLTLAQASAVAQGARLFGNGHLDLTARANIQIRGVTEATGAALSDRLAATGLGDVRTDGGPQRLTLTSPLAGHDPDAWIDGPAVARAIEAAGRAIPGLPAKTLVAIADHPGVAMPEADCCLTARGLGAIAITLSAGVGQRDLGLCTEGEAPGRVGALLSAFVRTGRRRMRDLTEDELTAVVEAMPASGAAGIDISVRQGGDGVSSTPAPFAPAAGLHARPDLQILAIEAPFGRCTADALDRVVAAAETLGVDTIRLSPTRGMVLLAAPGAPAAAVLADLAAAFVVATDDPRRHVDACTGAPGCASGSTPTLADAARVAELFRPLAARGHVAHVSGCAKGCARPGSADLTLIARAGLYGAVLGGAPSDEPRIHLPIEAVLDRLGRAKTVGLSAAFAPDIAQTGYGGDGRPV